MTYYILRLNYNNGYICGCCYRSWTHDVEITSDQSFEEGSDYKKSNHDVLKLGSIIYDKFCEAIQERFSGDEIDYSDYSIIYNYYNEDIERLVSLTWETPCDLQSELKKFETDFLNKKERREKATRINQLKSELRLLEK